MKKLLIFVLLFSIIFTKANLREENIEKKNFGVVVVRNTKSDIPTMPNNMPTGNVMNESSTTNNTGFWKKVLGWFGF